VARGSDRPKAAPDDPFEILHSFVNSQEEKLVRLRRLAADVGTDQKRLELEMNYLQMEINKIDSQSRKAALGGDPSLAEDFKARLSSSQRRMEDLQKQYSVVQETSNAIDRSIFDGRTLLDSFHSCMQSFKRMHYNQEVNNSLTVSSRVDSMVLIPTESVSKVAQLAILNELLSVESLSSDVNSNEDTDASRC
jgi:phage shock protein A